MVGVVLGWEYPPQTQIIWILGPSWWCCLGMFEVAQLAWGRCHSLGTDFGSRKSCLFPICSFCLVLMVKDVNSQHPCSCHLLPCFPIRMDSYPSWTIESKQTLPPWLALAMVFHQSNREQIGFLPPSGRGKAILTISDNYRNERKSKHAGHKNQGSLWRERYTSTGLE